VGTPNYHERPPGTRLCIEGMRPRHYSIAGMAEKIERESRPYFSGEAKNRAHQFSRLYGEFLRGLADELLEWGREHRTDEIPIAEFKAMQAAAKKVYLAEHEILAIRHQVADSEYEIRSLKAKLAAHAKLENQTRKIGERRRW
jgi:hypothetical protein